MDYTQTIVPKGSFTWGEYAYLPRWAVYAEPSETQRKNAVFLFSALQKIRDELKRPIIISSGARTPAYTQALRMLGIPAARKSAHNDWMAVDITCPSLNNKMLWAFCNARWQGRMENIAATPNWVHLDTRDWGSRTRFNP
jgi:uncharacterized protein YcbK (DUF882 family)